MRGHSFLIYQERITLSVQVMAGADEQKTEGRRCRLAALAWDLPQWRYVDGLCLWLDPRYPRFGMQSVAWSPDLSCPKLIHCACAENVSITKNEPTS